MEKLPQKFVAALLTRIAQSALLEFRRPKEITLAPAALRWYAPELAESPKYEGLKAVWIQDFTSHPEKQKWIEYLQTCSLQDPDAIAFHFLNTDECLMFGRAKGVQSESAERVWPEYTIALERAITLATGELIGYLKLHCITRQRNNGAQLELSAYIERLYIVPKFRSQGYGRAMVAAIAEAFGQHIELALRQAEPGIPLVLKVSSETISPAGTYVVNAVYRYFGVWSDRQVGRDIVCINDNIE